MDNDLNVTYFITFAGHVEVEKYRYLYFMIMLTVYILIICSNSTIVYLIWNHQNLHEPMYIFIAALLINSVLFSTVNYPKLLIDFLSERQIISYSACLFQVFAYYSLTASEFLLLAAMSYDRYVSICKPLQYQTIMTKTNVNVLLVAAWLVPACQVAVSVILSAKKKLCAFTLKGIMCNSTFQKLHCVRSTVLNVYGLVVLVNVVISPTIFVLFTYTRIFIIVYRSCREVRRKAAQTCLPHLIVLINFSSLTVYDVLLLRMGTEFPKIASFIMTLQLFMYHPLFNPIIYGLKMKEIYKPLKSLVCKMP